MKPKVFLYMVLLTFAISARAQQCTIANYMTAYRIPPTAFPYFSVGSGITVSVVTNVTNYADFSYNCGGNPYSGANPAWGVTSAAHYIRLTFSAPVTNLTILVNGTNQTEVFYFAAGTGAITLSNYCTPDFSAAGSSCTDNVAPAVGSIITVNNPIGSTTYTLTHNGLGAGSRYTLLDCFVATLPLPVELVSFTGKCITKNTAQLDWRTSSEKNNDFFTIERSKDGDNWEEAKVIPASDNQSGAQYSYTDKTGGEVLYYRLKQTDVNKNYKYSDAVTVGNCMKKSDDIIIYPNPATNEVSFTGNNINTVQLFNTVGVELINKKINTDQDLKIDISQLEPGIYFTRIREKTYKIIKQ